MNPFEEKSDNWVLYQAIAKAASKYVGAEEIYDNHIYHFLEKCPKTSLTVHIVDALNELGYKIVKQ